jgi:hypothetical protein
MTTNDSISKDKIKSFDNHKNYSNCDACTLNGYPNEKLVYEYEGLRSEDEEGFIYRFTEYEYLLQKRIVHKHKYNDELINRLVNQSLGIAEVFYKW